MTANRDLGKLVPLPSVAGQFLWNQATNAWVQVTKAMVGLPLVDNTADNAKPVSAPQQAALDLKAPIASPSFTGGASSTLAQRAFRARAPSGEVQTGFGLSIAGAIADQREFEWLSSSTGNPRMVFRSINDAYSAGHEFLTAYRAATGHLIDRLAIVGCNLIVGQTTQIDTNYGVQSTTGIYSAGPVRVGQYTLTTLPSASVFSGAEIDVTNATGGSKRCRSNGTVWQILNTTTTVS